MFPIQKSGLKCPWDLWATPDPAAEIFLCVRVWDVITSPEWWLRALIFRRRRVSPQINFLSGLSHYISAHCTTRFVPHWSRSISIFPFRLKVISHIYALTEGWAGFTNGWGDLDWLRVQVQPLTLTRYTSKTQSYIIIRAFRWFLRSTLPSGASSRENSIATRSIYM